MAHFQIENLTFSYAAAKNKRSLDDVSLTIEKGEYIVLCGKSGSGKTTLGQKLAKILQVEFIDLDAKIEEEQKQENPFYLFQNDYV